MPHIASERLFGLGLRKPHYSHFIDGTATVDFAEVISENFMFEGGRPLLTLDKVRENYPVALHGVSMSIGSVSGLDQSYLERLRALIQRTDPLFVSDHLCWTGFSGFSSHDLLPLPYTDEAFAVVARNIHEAQESLCRQILVENPTSYIAFDHSTMSEWEFLGELSSRTGCGLLLDVNNIYVSAHNHGFDPSVYIDALIGRDVQQIHLAGHDDGDRVYIDAHDREVCEAVWQLYRRVAQCFPHAATMIERDDSIPPLDHLVAELDRARRISACVAA